MNQAKKFIATLPIEPEENLAAIATPVVRALVFDMQLAAQSSDRLL